MDCIPIHLPLQSDDQVVANGILFKVLRKGRIQDGCMGGHLTAATRSCFNGMQLEYKVDIAQSYI